MVMIRTVVIVFTWIFTVLIIFVMFNTILVGSIYPLFDDLADNLTFVNQNRYDNVRQLNTNAFYIVFAIMGATPFIFLIVKALFSREPAPQGGFTNAIRI